MAKSWKKSDVTYLRRYAAKRTVADLARRFGAEESEIRTKLQELGLESADGDSGSAGGFDDPQLPKFQEGIEALAKGDAKSAAKLFGEVAAKAEQIEVAERARRYQAAARLQLDKVAADDVDSYLEAVLLRNDGNLEEALKLCRAKANRDEERFLYLSAGILALQGELDEAAEALGRAVELNPKNRVHAYHDTDFQELRSSEGHRQLFEA